MKPKQVGRRALSLIRKYYPNVKTLFDATGDVQLTVTQRDCSLAKSGKPDECAIARAAKREWDGAIISLSNCYLIRDNAAMRLMTPQSVQRELVSFDRSHDFRAGTFTLRKPAKSEKLGRSGGKSKLETPRHNRGILQYHHKTSGIRSL